MQVQVKKWGNSASVRLPSYILQNANLKLDDYVDIHEEDGRIIIEPVRAQKLSLEALLSEITPDNLHQEEFADTPTGREWF